MRGWSWAMSLFAGIFWAGMRTAQAANLADVFRKPAFSELGLAPLGTALATTVASAYPVASASSSVVYEYDFASDTLARRLGVAGPLFGERAATIGRGKLNVGLSYSYIHFSTIDGDDLDSLPSRPRVKAHILSVPVRGGVTLRDGRFTTFLPVQVTADVDVTANQVEASATYGVTPHLDVNLTVPLLHTSLDLTANGRVPDPRFPSFALPGGRMRDLAPSASADATGIGDVLLRAKYKLHQRGPVDVAVGIMLALPSGEEDDFQGAGATRVRPTLILSRVFARRFEPFLNAGVDCNADHVERSVATWAVGGAAEVFRGVTTVVTFLGRNELGPQAEAIRLPFFFQIERNDIYDFSIGVHWRLAESAHVAADVILPLNRDGLRPDAIPVLQAEYVF